MADKPRQQRRLLLSSLDPTRLADLVASLLFPVANWMVLRRSEGRLGAGIPEFVGRENAGQGVQRTWWAKIQFDDHAQPSSLIGCLQALVSNADRVPDVFLLVTTSDVSQAAVDELREAASHRGIDHVIVWTRSDLEKRLYAERPELLFAYFGVSSFRRWQRKVRAIRRRVQLKQRMVADFVKPAVARPRTASRPFEKFKHAKVILRSIDDESYPEVETQLGVSRGWLEVGTYDFYHDGLEVIVASVDVAVDGDGHWAPIPVGYAHDASRFNIIRAFEVGRVPYDHVVDYDLTGDEFYRQPHLFCLFAAAGLPFAEFRYYAVEDPYRVRLHPKKMLDLAAICVSGGGETTLPAERTREARG